MASKTEIEPIKSQSSRSSNQQNSSIDDAPTKNLEYFPYKVLVKIFTHVDDIGLLHLANISYRFDGFAQMVFKKRYATKYFIIDGETEQQQDVYREQFSRFGRGIKAIEVNNVHDIDGTSHWMAQMLNEHTNNLQKLAFNRCTFRNATEIFAQHPNLTHLALQANLYGTEESFEFPTYRNLKSLKLANYSNIPLQTVQQIASNNPKLECLDIRYCENFTLPEIMKLIATNNLRQLKHLAVLSGESLEDFPPANSSIERFVGFVEHLETLALTVDNDLIDLLRNLGLKCKMIKQLELCQPDLNMESEMVAAISTFQNVEILKITQATYDDHFERLIECLPSLCELQIDMYKPNGNAYILTIFQKCPLLERLVLVFDHDRDEFATFVDMKFYNKLLDLVQNRPVRIEYMEYGEAVCYVTTTEIVWQKKLIHWIGYDPLISRSDLQLMDLASASSVKSLSKSPFDLILEYLDLGSLYALYRTSKECKRVVGVFVEKRSQNGQKFVCTDEFSSNFNEMCPFGSHVNHLEVKLIYYRNLEPFRTAVEQSYKKLRTLYFRSCLETCPHDFVVPQIRHFVFNSGGFRNYCDLNEILRICGDLETMEFVNSVEFADDSDANAMAPPCNIKRFTFKPIDSENQMEFLNEYFQGKQVDVIAKL